jgi:hypothetical protein
MNELCAHLGDSAPIGLAILKGRQGPVNRKAKWFCDIARPQRHGASGVRARHVYVDPGAFEGPQGGTARSNSNSRFVRRWLRSLPAHSNRKRQSAGRTDHAD